MMNRLEKKLIGVSVYRWGGNAAKRYGIVQRLAAMRNSLS